MADEAKEAGKPARCWEFTLNNYTEDEYKCLCNLSEAVKRIAIAKETGENGTPHLQGRIHFGTNKRLSALKKINGRAHWERTRAIKDWTYYFKEDADVFHVDNSKGQGTRTDLQEVYKLARKGHLKTIAEEHTETFLKYHAALTRISSLRNADPTPRRFKPKIYWLYGSTGVGKTRGIVERERDAYDDNEIWWSSNDCKSFFRGWANQRVAVFDDFRPDQMSFSMLLKITDRYQVAVPVLYGSKEWNCKRIYFTAPFHPRTMFENQSGQGECEQLVRRIGQIIEVEKDVPIEWDDEIEEEQD